MKAPFLGLVSALVIGSAVFSLSPQAGTHEISHSSSLCESHTLSPRPYLVSSAAWSRSDLLLLDPLRSEILRYSAAGAFRGSTPQELRGALEVFPGRISLDHLDVRGNGAETMLEGSGHFVLLDNEQLPAQLADFSAQTTTDRKSGREVALGHIYQWQREGSQDLLAVAEIRQQALGARDSGPEEFQYGFVGLSLNDPSRLIKLRSWPSTSGPGSAKTFYRLGMPLLAGSGDASYALIFEDGKMQLLRHEAGNASFDSRPLESFSKLASALGLAVPRLPQLVFPDDAVAVMRAVESATMPVGLYYQGKYLYVLSRRPGSRPWTLSVIDPELDRWLGSVEVPSGARHLAAVPGATWAFIEKSSLEGWQRQTIYGVLTLPSEAIDSLRGCR